MYPKVVIELALLAERTKILKTIAEDMEKYAKEFDGKPFTGKTVAEYNANQGAAIAALADIVRAILEEKSGA